MNRQQIFASIMMILVSAASADEQGFKVSAGLGRASAEFDGVALQNQLPSGASHISENSDTSWQLSLSMAFTPSLYGTLGYVDLGQGELTINSQALDPAGLHQQLKGTGPRLGRGWIVGSHGTVWQHRAIKLQMAGGFIFNRNTIDSRRDDGQRVLTQDKDTALYGGFGVGYQMTKQWQMSIDWRRYFLDANDVDSLSMGISYQF